MTEPKYLAVPALRDHHSRRLCKGCAFWRLPVSECQPKFNEQFGHSCALKGRLQWVAIENTDAAKTEYAAARMEE